MSELKEYCTIYLYIKKTNPSLFQLIEDTCTSHIFNYRYVTFLMPNSGLLNKMKKEKPSTTAKMLKSLMLKGVFNTSSELTGDIFNIAQGKLTKVSNLKVKPDPKFIQWDGYTNLSVLLYDDADVPVADEQPRKDAPSQKKSTLIVKKPETSKVGSGVKKAVKKMVKKVVKKTVKK
jgi:hypothetical protein